MTEKTEQEPTTAEFLKMLEEAKTEWKRYNTMRDAAPDMLAALKSARYFIMGVPEAVTVSGDAALYAIDQAIDKAEGRE